MNTPEHYDHKISSMLEVLLSICCSSVISIEIRTVVELGFLRSKICGNVVQSDSADLKLELKIFVTFFLSESFTDCQENRKGL